MLKNPLLIAGSTELGGAFSAARWAYAGRMTLLGMVMIFAVLGLLWGVLSVFKYVMVGKTPKEEKNKSAVAEVVAESVAAAETEPIVPATDDGELVAVIAAAIAAYRASEGMDATDASAFRVVSFRRATNGRAWNIHR